MMRRCDSVELIPCLLLAGPEMVIVDGSDLTNYRAYSNRVFRLARTVLGPTTAVEKLGMDELFLDVTGLVRSHVGRLEASDARVDNHQRAWFALEGDDGFWYGPGTYAGHLLPSTTAESPDSPARTVSSSRVRETQAASHLATHLRSLILCRIGLTSSAGIAPSKLLSKLLASVNKPADQTTLAADASPAAVRAFLDPLDLRKLPGFGSTIVSSLLPILPPDLDGSAPTKPSVGLVRREIGLADFQKLYTVRLAPFLHGLLSGIDNSPVVPSPDFPAQISTEDSFATTVNHHGGMLWTDFVGHLRRLLENLILRLENELQLPSDSPTADVKGKGREQRWARYPQTLRLSLRRSWDAPASARSSRSIPMPAGIFAQSATVSQRVMDLFGGPGAKDGVGGVVGGLVRALLGKDWAANGLQVYVCVPGLVLAHPVSLRADCCDYLQLSINWAATSLSTTLPAAPDQTLAAFFSAASPAPARPAKRKVPTDLDLEMLRSLPADVRADVLADLGLTDADLAFAEKDEQGPKRVKTGPTSSSMPSSKAEVIDLTDDPPEPAADDGELWEQWPADELVDCSADVPTARGIMQCPVPDCNERLFPFALQAHLAYHDS
jgi:DNA polymerase iota